VTAKRPTHISRMRLHSSMGIRARRLLRQAQPQGEQVDSSLVSDGRARRVCGRHTAGSRQSTLLYFSILSDRTQRECDGDRYATGVRWS